MFGQSEENERLFFTKEINTLSIILTLFSISYLLRVIYDSFAVSPTYPISFFFIDMVSLFSTIPFDLLPLVVVLFYHRRNLSRIDQ